MQIQQLSIFVENKAGRLAEITARSEEHTSELQSLSC